MQSAIKNYANAANYALSCVMVPVNGFGSANSSDIATCVAGTSYSSCWDGIGASNYYSEGIIAFPCYIIAAYCI